MGPGKIGGGRKSSEVPPDGVACGKHSDPVVPENERVAEVRGQLIQTLPTSADLGSEHHLLSLNTARQKNFKSSSEINQEPKRSAENPTDLTSAPIVKVCVSGDHGNSSSHPRTR